MGNEILTADVIANEALMELENNMVMGNLVHRQYKHEFVSGVGDTISIRKPVKFTVNKGADITGKINDVTEKKTTFQITERDNVPWKFSSQELTLDITEYSKRYIKPACEQLANGVDVFLTNLYKQIPLACGVAGTTPSTFAHLGAAANNLDKNGVNQADRRIVLNSDARWALADHFKDFNDGKTSGKARKGVIGEMAGFGTIAMDQNIADHTAGDHAGTVAVDGAGQTGSTLHIDGFTTATAELKEGDVFTIEGVYRINKTSRVQLKELQQFTVTADATAVANEVDISIKPEIITSGAYQTVSDGPADGAELTFIGSHTANLAFHKNALGLVTVPIEIPSSVKFGARATSKNGLSVRVIKFFDGMKDEEYIRLDIMYGAKVLYGDLATRLLG